MLDCAFTCTLTEYAFLPPRPVSAASCPCVMFLTALLSERALLLDSSRRKDDSAPGLWNPCGGHNWIWPLSASHVRATTEGQPTHQVSLSSHVIIRS